MIHAERLERRRALREEAIVDAALGLLAHEGLEGLTLQRVAGAIDCVPAALYRYYPGKDALVAAMQRRTVSALHARLTAFEAGLGAHLAGLDLTARERALAAVLGLGRFFFDAHAAMPDAFRLVQALLADPRRLVGDADAARTAPLVAALFADLGRIVAEAAERGALEPGDATLRVLVLWAALQGALSLEKLARFEPARIDVRAIGRAAQAALLRGFGARPAALARALSALDGFVPAEPPAT
ncbi:MAG: helix-turn-helix transcriptional regulator [Myxococcales bacterium]|nr:helix-turn-helix transcriptional regulator [Myxococcales bacterium]